MFQFVSSFCFYIRYSYIRCLFNCKTKLVVMEIGACFRKRPFKPCFLFLSLFLNALFFSPLRAQTHVVVTGTVQNAEAAPLPGVTVSVKGGSQKTVSGESGRFELKNVGTNATLVFTSVGFDAQEVPLNGRNGLTITLAAGNNKLNEVVVVSYGRQRQREVTGSIATVKSADLQDMPVNQFAQQLQGKVAGVQVNQYSGQPGRGMAFRIRGAASLFADNQPLFVVDGIPVTGGINNINPAEIETFTVLKDASSTALYGSRAANGVVLITTKHARPGDAKIEVNSFYGIQKIPDAKIPKLMNAREFAQYQKEIYEDKVKYEAFTGALDPVYRNPDSLGEGTDWYHTVTRSAPIQSYTVSLSSGTARSSTAVILGYSRQNGVVVNTGTQLYSLRLNHELRLANDKVRVGFNLAPSYRLDHNNRMETDGLDQIFQDVVEASPLIPAVNPDGSMPLFVNSPGMVSTVNPYATMVQTIDNYKTTRVLGNTYLNYEFIRGLALKTNLAVDKVGETRMRFVPSTIVAGGVATGLSSTVDNWSWTGEANLQYNKTFFGHHNVEALVGYSAQQFNNESSSVSGTNYPSNDVPFLSAATSISAGTSNASAFSLLSEIARLNYNYKGKYLLSGAVRRDGSSRFGANRKYGWFPSVSAGWVLSDEKFMEGFSAVNQLKLRASYGITGNNNIGNYTFVANTAAYNYVLNGAVVSGTTISSLGNSELGWERNKQFDVGLDLSLVRNRISFTYDYYHKLTDGLIQDRPIPNASGFSTIKFNIGVFEFWGHEFTLNTVNLTGPLKWSTDFNLSFDRNVIKSLVSPGFLRRNNTTSSDYYRNQEGHHIGEFYGIVWEGIFKDSTELKNHAPVKWGTWYSSVGTPKITDVSGPNGKPDGIIDENDRTFIGDPTPDFNFGLTNDFAYKNFDLNIVMAGAVGGKIMNASYLYLANLMGARMALKEVKDRWRSPENPGSGYYPRTMTNTSNPRNQVNSQLIEDGSYLAAKNISLGYRFNLKNNPVMQNLRVYASVQQAFILTKYRGVNPEVNDGGADPTKGIGIDTNAYPVPRTFSLGLNLTFK